MRIEYDGKKYNLKPRFFIIVAIIVATLIATLIVDGTQYYGVDYTRAQWEEHIEKEN